MCAPAHTNGENASELHDSPVHSESNPSASACCAVSMSSPARRRLRGPVAELASRASGRPSGSCTGDAATENLAPAGFLHRRPEQRARRPAHRRGGRVPVSPATSTSQTNASMPMALRIASTSRWRSGLTSARAAAPAPPSATRSRDPAGAAAGRASSSASSESRSMVRCCGFGLGDGLGELAPSRARAGPRRRRRARPGGGARSCRDSGGPRRGAPTGSGSSGRRWPGRSRPRRRRPPRSGWCRPRRGLGRRRSSAVRVRCFCAVRPPAS